MSCVIPVGVDVASLQVLKRVIEVLEVCFPL